MKFSVTEDPTDNKFLECAYEAGAPYLLTGNLRHYPRRFRGIHVVTPREFLPYSPWAAHTVNWFVSAAH